MALPLLLALARSHLQPSNWFVCRLPVGSLVFIPQDNGLESVLRLVAAGGFFAAFGVLFLGGFVIGALQEE